eukprot:556284-Prorocentrum_minimum.AAC.2
MNSSVAKRRVMKGLMNGRFSTSAPFGRQQKRRGEPNSAVVKGLRRVSGGCQEGVRRGSGG